MTNGNPEYLVPCLSSSKNETVPDAPNSPWKIVKRRQKKKDIIIVSYFEKLKFGKVQIRKGSRFVLPNKEVKNDFPSLSKALNYTPLNHKSSSFGDQVLKVHSFFEPPN